MFTIFSTCRSFEHPRFNEIQHAAIQSWLKLDQEIIILGKDAGTAEACKKYGLKHEVNIEYNEHGVPMLNSMINRAEELASNDLMLLVSSDIVIPGDIDIPGWEQFCGVCQKIECPLQPIDFQSNWLEQIQTNPNNTPSLLTSGDFFLYTKGFWKDMPPFIIGRSWCDSWMFKHAHDLECMIDLTDKIKIYHLTHDYSHVTPQFMEWEANQRLAGGNSIDISHATIKW